MGRPSMPRSVTLSERSRRSLFGIDVSIDVSAPARPALPWWLWLARGLGTATVVLVGAAVYLAIASKATSSALPLAPFGLVGYIVAVRQPRNPLGWILLGLAFVFTLASDGGAYAVMAYRQGYDLPFPRVAAFLAAFWISLVILAPLTIGLFPDGRLSRGWRRVVATYIAVASVMLVWTIGTDIAGIAAARIRVDATGAFQSTDRDPGPAGLPFVFLFVVCCVAFVVKQVRAYRRSTGDRRQQLKWLALGGGIALGGLFLTLTFGGSGGPINGLGGAGFFCLVALPVGMGVGILKYRLYDIDRLISRTLSYAILTGLLAGVFVGLVGLATDVLPFSSPVAVAASTLAVAALFNPLRTRIQRLVDRRFNRSRYDAEAIVSVFGSRLRNAVDLDTVRHELEGAVARTVEPAHVSLWIRPVR